MSRIWLELKSKEYFRDRIAHEEEMRFRRCSALQTPAEPLPFSEFADPKGYGGKVPSRKELTRSLFE